MAPPAQTPSRSPALHRGRWLIAAAALAVCAGPAFANPGAAAAWQGMGFAIAGTVVIGGVEAIVVTELGGKHEAWKTIPAINLVSTLIGMLIGPALCLWLLEVISPEPLVSAMPASIMTCAVLMLLGPVIEAPVFAACFRDNGRVRRKPFWTALIGAHLLTNAGLVLVFVLTWEMSLVTDTTRVASPAEVIRGEANERVRDSAGGLPWVYYIDEDERTIRRVRLDGSDAQDVARSSIPLMPRDRDDVQHLFLAGGLNPDGEPHLGLVSFSTRIEGNEPLTIEPLLDGVDATAAQVEDDIIFLPRVGAVASISNRPLSDGSSLSWPRFSADLRPSTGRQVRVEHWSMNSDGLELRSDTITRRLALWNGLIRDELAPQSPSVLPGDVLVFEFNHAWKLRASHGIYVLDTNTMRIARLANGRCPVVVYDAPIEGWEPPKEWVEWLEAHAADHESAP